MAVVRVLQHDDTSVEVFVIPDSLFARRRFSVIVRRAIGDRATIVDAAWDLAAYARLVTRTEVVFNRRSLLQEIRRIETTERVAERLARVDVNGIDLTPYINNVRFDRSVGRFTKTEDAEQKAKQLLALIDPVLEARVSVGSAFYFVTTSNTYIWYPSEKAIISLDEDAPHFVCVHSMDHTVETNLYDWALTMRTYLLGAESHWRSTANFHAEWRSRRGVQSAG